MIIPFLSVSFAVIFLYVVSAITTNEIKRLRRRVETLETLYEMDFANHVHTLPDPQSGTCEKCGTHIKSGRPIARFLNTTS